MTAVLGQLAPWLVLGAILLTLAVLYGREKRKRGVAETIVDQEKGNAETRKDVADIHARDLSRDERAAEAQRVLDARDAARRH